MIGEATTTWRVAVAMAIPLLVVAAQFTGVRPTNFAGADEWLVLSLASRGIVDFPYAGRPLALLWCLPAELIVRHDLMSHLVTQVAYLAAAGALVAWIAIRRLGLSPLMGMTAGVVTAAWAPLDRMRLDPVVTTRYTGATAASVLAILLFVEGWRRGRPLLAAAGAVIAAVSVLSLEGTLPLIAGAPLVILFAFPGTWSDGAARKRLLVWTAAWAVALLVSAAPLLLSVAGLRGEGYQYQSRIGLDLHPLRLGGSLLQQLGFAVTPAVTTPPGQLARLPVALAVGAFLIGGIAVARRNRAVEPDRRALLGIAALGLALAVLGWLGLVVGPLLRTAARGQFLCAPGLGLLFAAVIGLAGSWRPRARVLVSVCLGAWIVAVGTARIGMLQDEWDRTSVWPGERATMAQLVDYAPRLAPNTVVVLIDESRSWLVTLIFRHAVHYVYGESVVGVMWKGNDFFSPTTFAPDGIRSEPFAGIREVWRTPASHHRYDEAVVARFTADRRLEVLDEWPAEIGALPPGATYTPRARIVPGPPSPAARVLARER